MPHRARVVLPSHNFKSERDVLVGSKRAQQVWAVRLQLCRAFRGRECDGWLALDGDARNLIL